jgi:hypothetical protein
VAGVIMQEQPARAERGACNPCVPSDEHVPSISVLHLSLCAKLDRLVQIHKKEGAGPTGVLRTSHSGGQGAAHGSRAGAVISVHTQQK